MEKINLAQDCNDMGTSIYLDFNATTPLEREVLKAVTEGLENGWGNPSSKHASGQIAKQIIHQARCQVSKMINSASEDDIIFTSGGTESNNWVLQTARQYYKQFYQKLSLTQCSNKTYSLLSPLPHFITTNIEHDSIKLVLEYFETNNLAEVTFVPVCKETACINVRDLLAAIRPNTCMITVMLANNETGVIQPVAQICEEVKNLKREKNLPKMFTHTDAAQAIGKVMVDVQDLGVDFLTVVGHKFYGPRIGALYADGLHKNTAVLFPLFFGGGQERNLRPGTENTGMIAGLGKAAQLVSENINLYNSHMKGVRDYLEEQLQQSFEIHINGKHEKTERLPNTCNVSFIGDRFEGHRILAGCKYLQAGVGAACHSAKPSQVLLNSGVPLKQVVNSIRLSVGRHTTKNDIDIVIEDLKQSVNHITSNK